MDLHSRTSAWWCEFGVETYLLHPIALPILDEAALHLRDHAKDREHHVAHFTAGTYMRVEDGHEGASLFDLVNLVEDVSSIATKSINHQFVARAQKAPPR